MSDSIQKWMRQNRKVWNTSDIYENINDKAGKPIGIICKKKMSYFVHQLEVVLLNLYYLLLFFKCLSTYQSAQELMIVVSHKHVIFFFPPLTLFLLTNFDRQFTTVTERQLYHTPRCIKFSSFRSSFGMFVPRRCCCCGLF